MNAREEILRKLKAGRKNEPPARPPVPPLAEFSWSREKVVEEFVKNLETQTAVVYRVKDYQGAAEKLAELVTAEGIKKVAASTDEVVTRLELAKWGKKHHIEILEAENYPDRNSFKQMVFDRAEASITGVDFAIAESGTLCIKHCKSQPRLVSLAPIMHIALVPLDRLYPVYEDVIDRIFSASERLPSQVAFITGPSMTADIQGVPFKGMHGPKKLTVILIG